VRGPLFSVIGTGKIGKTVVYRERKKIKDVKKYAIPRNPKSEGQNEQRGYLRTAIEAWRTDGFNIPDVEAWKLYASIQKKKLSGINMYTSLRINQLKEGKEWTKMHDCNTTLLGPTGVWITIEGEQEKTINIYMGTTKIRQTEKYIGIWSGEFWEVLTFDLVPDTRYYFYGVTEGVQEVARTGLYTFKTQKIS